MFSDNLGNSVKLDTTPTSSATSSGTYNIFRSAFNRGTELLKSTFLVKPPQQLGASTSQLQIQTQRFGETPVVISDSEEESDSDSSHANDTPNKSNGSSPDSIKTELMLFRPISREPRTISSIAKIIRVPSIRSTSSSTSSVVHSPCPSPFFIPITPNRQSAFSFVVHTNDSNDSATPPTLQPKTSNKRKGSKILNAEKKSETSLKRQKRLDVTEAAIVIVPVKKQTRYSTSVKAEKNKCKEKTENIRETRSRKRNLDQEETKVFKSPQKPAAKRKVTVSNVDDSERRITRSRSIKKL